MNNADKLFRSLEIMSDNFRTTKNIIPDGFDVSILSARSNPYFKQYGFKVPEYISELFYKYNGIKSDKYISGGLYYYSITPYLINLNCIPAYDDKNIYSQLFPNIAQPDTVVKCMNGRYFVPTENSIVEISVDETVDYIYDNESVIIKPSIGTGGGKGVELWIPQQLQKDGLKRRILEFGNNFIVQKIIKNHPDLARFNPTSLNTCRIYTYRRVGTRDYVVLGSAIRFGGKGSFRDNACSGGGFCRINEDGFVDDRIYSYNSFEHRSLETECKIKKIQIPHYKEILNNCIKLHKSLPYIDIVGWDITIDDNDKIVLIEYNYSADSEFLQIFNGPMFGEYTDELMEALQNSLPVNKEVIAVKRSFENGSANYEYIFDMSKKDSL